MSNLFRGRVEASQVFPFPMYLNQEQIEYVGAFVDPVTKYFTEAHDAAKYDLQEKLDPETLDHLWELGAFGLMAPAEYGGLELNNTQFGRLAEIVGMNDLGTGVTMGAHQSIGYKVGELYTIKEITFFCYADNDNETMCHLSGINFRLILVSFLGNTFVWNERAERKIFAKGRRRQSICSILLNRTFR